MGELFVPQLCSRWKRGPLGTLSLGRGACVWNYPVCGLRDPGGGVRQRLLLVETLRMIISTLWRENKGPATGAAAEVSSSPVFRVWMSFLPRPPFQSQFYGTQEPSDKIQGELHCALDKLWTKNAQLCRRMSGQEGF